MKPVAGLLTALFILVAGLSGCLGDEAPPPASQAATNETNETGVGLVADTAEAKENATKTGEFQKSLDDRVHFHDAWNGRTELVIMEAPIQSGPSTPPLSIQAPMSYFSTLRDGGVGGVTFELPEGQVILPETKEIVVTVAFDASATASAMRVMWKTAAEKTGDNMSEPIPPGGAITIPTTVEANDIPHTTVSKWRFRLVPENDATPSYWNGTATVTITIKRDPVLLLSPPHPDHWLDETSKILFHESFPAKQTWVILPMEATSKSTGFGQIEMPDGAIIPPHTGKVLITLNWTNSDTTFPTNPRPAIYYSGANARGFNAPDEVTYLENTLTAAITVTPEMTDSPYDTTTNWAFYVILDSDSPSPFGPFGQVASFDGTIDLHIEIVREDKA